MTGLQRESFNCNYLLSSARSALSPALCDNYERDSSPAGTESIPLIKSLSQEAAGLEPKRCGIGQDSRALSKDLQGIDKESSVCGKSRRDQRKSALFAALGNLTNENPGRSGHRSRGKMLGNHD